MSIFRNGTHSKDRAPEAPQARALGAEAGGNTGWLHLAVPGASVLITLLLFGYAINAGTMADREPGRLAAAGGQQRGAQSLLPLGVLQSGDSNQNNLVYLTTGAAGDAVVEAGWIKNLTVKLGAFASPDLQAKVMGNEASGERTLHSFMYNMPAAPALLAQQPLFVMEALLAGSPQDIQLAQAVPAEARGGKAALANANVAALQSVSIEFPANSAKISARSVARIKRAAGIIKQLPAGTIVELNGYTAGMGKSAADSNLSRQRAESVYTALASAGISPDMLSPRGSGSASALASNSSELEGRSSTAAWRLRSNARRVEFRVVLPPQ
ncbi:MAG: OmpA family protein [Beijerinckiaceae bacterium]|nr:OmpA family protein [Beijerinckiaceae bacterium]